MGNLYMEARQIKMRSGAFDNVEEAIKGITGLPAAPEETGNYILQCAVTESGATYTWETAPETRTTTRSRSSAKKE